MGILDKIKATFHRDKHQKRKSKKRTRKDGGYKSREEFQRDFENRYGKPGRVPEDVA